MAQTGFTPIQLYSTSTAAAAPVAGNLTNSTLGSELAINITDGKLFYKDNANAVQVIGWKVVPATAGGTGQTSYAVGDLLYADTTTSLAKLADVATGNALISGGVGVAPAWGKIGLTTHVSGTLPVANGGTGTATAFTAGSVVFAGTSGVYSQDNAQLFWDDTNNRLGLGVTNPSVKLDLQGTGADHLFRALNTGASASDDSILLIQTSSTGATNTISGLYFGDGDSQSVGQLRYNHSNNSMVFYTDSNARLAIDNTGDVGVNTTSPNIAGWNKAITLNGNAAENAAYELSFDGALTGYLSYSTSTSQVNLYNFANAPLQFGTNNTARLTISETGLVTLVSTSGLSIGRTAVTSPAAGDGNVFSGTYTPSLTNTTNIAASTASVCQYMRVGNVVTVSGTVAIDPTATGQIVMGMSLPIASNFSGAANCGGTFVGSAVTTINLGAVIGDATNDRATFDGVVADTANRTYGFTFTYRII